MGYDAVAVCYALYQRNCGCNHSHSSFRAIISGLLSPERMQIVTGPDLYPPLYTRHTTSTPVIVVIIQAKRQMRNTPYREQVLKKSCFTWVRDVKENMHGCMNSKISKKIKIMYLLPVLLKV